MAGGAEHTIATTTAGEVVYMVFVSLVFRWLGIELLQVGSKGYFSPTVCVLRAAQQHGVHATDEALQAP